MNIEDYNLVSIAEKANLLVCHLYCAVMHLGKQLDCVFQFLSVELNLRISHLDGRQFFSLTVKLLLLPFEIFQTVANVTSFNLLASEVFNLASCLLHVIFAKLNQTQVLFKVLLLPMKTSFLHFQSI